MKKPLQLMTLMVSLLITTPWTSQIIAQEQKRDINIALIEATTTGDLAHVQDLLKNNANPNYGREDGTSPLMLAAGLGHLNIVSALLTNGANVNAKNNNGATALMFAAESGHTGIVNLLLPAGANVNAKNDNGATALTFAAEYGHIGIVNLLLPAGADIDARLTKGVTGLIPHTLGIFTTTTEGASALMLATMFGHTSTVQTLLDKGADPNVKSSDGATALMLAASLGHIDIVKALISKGADVNSQDNPGYTALSRAKLRSFENVVKLLEDAGAQYPSRQSEKQVNVEDKQNTQNVERLVTEISGKIDKTLVAEIVKKGPQKRIVIDILTSNEKNSQKTSSFQEFLILQDNKVVKHETLFPLQKFTIGAGGVKQVSPQLDDYVLSLADGATIHLLGKNELRGFVFVGETNDPLTFLLLRPYGLVYFGVKGKCC